MSALGSSPRCSRTATRWSPPAVTPRGSPISAGTTRYRGSRSTRTTRSRRARPSPTQDPIDVVYYLVHGIGQPGFREADNLAAANVAAAAKDAGVRRIVYLGGFVPDDDSLSEHLTSRAEVAAGVDRRRWPRGGVAGCRDDHRSRVDVVRDAALRRRPVPAAARCREWSANPIDPISIRDVVHYLVAAADTDAVPAGAYDISGPETTTYGDLLRTYARIAGIWRTPVSVSGIDTGLVSWVTGLVLPVPGGLAADLVESLDYPMMASDGRACATWSPDPPGGLLWIEDAMRSRCRAVAHRRPVNDLADPHHLADTDPQWAGGDA